MEKNYGYTDPLSKDIRRDREGATLVMSTKIQNMQNVEKIVEIESDHYILRCKCILRRITLKKIYHIYKNIYSIFLSVLDRYWSIFYIVPLFFSTSVF